LDSEYKNVIDWLYVCYMKSLKLPEAVSHMTDDLLQDQVYSKNRVVLGLYYALRNEVTGSEF